MKPKKTINILFMALVGASLLISSCRKHRTNPPSTFKPDKFVFGYEGGFCLACNRLYLLKNDSVYFSYGYYAGDTTTFSSVAFSGNKYQVAKPLIDNFPAFLLAVPDSIYGFPPNPDQGYIILACKNAGVTRQWSINRDTTKLPVQIRLYVNQVLNTLDSM